MRAARVARGDFQILTEAARLLSAGLVEISPAIQRLQLEAKQSAKQIQAQGSQLTAYRAEELIRQTPLEHGLRLIRLQLTPADAASAADAKMLAGKVAAQAEKTAVILAWGSGEENEPATIIVARSRDLDLDCGAVLHQALSSYNGRGGGSKDMAQGSVPKEQLLSVINHLSTAALLA